MSGYGEMSGGTAPWLDSRSKAADQTLLMVHYLMQRGISQYTTEWGPTDPYTSSPPRFGSFSSKQFWHYLIDDGSRLETL